MFNKQSNKAMVETQQEMESLMTRFEKQVFEAVNGDVALSLYGTMEIASLDAPELMSLPAFNAAYEKAIADLKKARAVALVKIRNNIQKRHRVDMSAIVPEMKEAVAYLNSLQDA